MCARLVVVLVAAAAAACGGGDGLLLPYLRLLLDLEILLGAGVPHVVREAELVLVLILPPAAYITREQKVDEADRGDDNDKRRRHR